METPIVITPGGQPMSSIIEIRDYVGGYEFTLDSVNKIAHRMKILPHGSEPGLTVLPAHAEYPTEDVPQSALVTLRFGITGLEGDGRRHNLGHKDDKVSPRRYGR